MAQVYPHVVDLSHHNFDDRDEPVDWQAAKRDGLWGVIFKATESDDYVDDTYDEVRRQVKAAGGILWGAYHFFRPGDVKRQVEHFLTHAAPGPDTLLVLDHEDTGCSLEDVILFLSLVESYTGQRPALYSGHVLKEQIGDHYNAYLAGTRLWLAQYGPEPEPPLCWREVWLWQYTDGHEGPTPHGVDGIGNCDVNSFDGTQERLNATWAEASIEPPIPEPEPPRPPMPDNEVPVWLSAMRAITGMTEYEGSADNPRIMHMADTIGRAYPHQKAYADLYTGDDVAWCGLTVGYCMTLAGVEPVFGDTDTERWMWAQAWGDWDQSMHLQEPRLGCVVVMTREGGGHVTLFEGWEGGNLLCRGGNQSDQVKVSSYDPATVIAYVWPRERPRVQVALDTTESAWVQASLNLLNGASLEVDGDLGPMSREAIAAYQIGADLHATGLADKKTVAQMLSDLESWNNARPPRNRK